MPMPGRNVSVRRTALDSGVDRRGNRAPNCCVQLTMDAIEAAAIRADGYDPDDPAVREALDFVRWELQLARGR